MRRSRSRCRRLQCRRLLTTPWRRKVGKVDEVDKVSEVDKKSAPPAKSAKSPSASHLLAQVKLPLASLLATSQCARRRVGMRRLRRLCGRGEGGGRPSPPPALVQHCARRDPSSRTASRLAAQAASVVEPLVISAVDRLTAAISVPVVGSAALRVGAGDSRSPCIESTAAPLHVAVLVARSQLPEHRMQAHPLQALRRQDVQRSHMPTPHAMQCV